MVGVAQAESQAVRNLVLQHRHRLVAYLSYHSFGQKILYPWSFTESKVPDWTELHHMANNLASGIYDASGGQSYYKIGNKTLYTFNQNVDTD